MRHKDARPGRLPYILSSMLRRLCILLSGLAVAGCGAAAGEGGSVSGTERSASGSPVEDGRPASCPAVAESTHPLPGVTQAQRTPAYWLQRIAAQQGDPDQVLLSARDVRDHNAALAAPVDGHPLGFMDLLSDVDPAWVLAQVNERLAFMRERIADGTYVTADAARLDPQPYDPVSVLPPAAPEWRVVLSDLPLGCGPVAGGIYTAPAVDLRFDRNNCSTAHEQEVVQILSVWPNGSRLLRTRYSMGWVPAEAPLSPPIPAELREAFVRGPRAAARGAATLSGEGGRVEVPDGTLLPLAPGSRDRVLFATEAGLFTSDPVAGLAPTTRPLTRRAVVEEAFRLLDSPYGWGGTGGGRDCSRFLLDVFESFGMQMPRFSGRQALAGTFGVDVSSVESEREKGLLIDAAARKGVVLLHFPGHIMLYLGRDDDGRQMAIHAFAEYVTPCDGQTGDDGEPLETLRKVDRITVSDLELGRGSSRKSFIERITRVVVLGGRPGVELQGPAELRAHAPMQEPPECRDSMQTRIFESPIRPNARQPLRLIATTSEDPGPVGLTLIDPDGNRHEPELHRLGGPPYSYWVQVDAPAAGQWTVLFGDGERVEACDRVRVVPHGGPLGDRPAHMAWEPRWRWETDTENMYSAFVEQLFTEPVDEDVTWPRLQVLIDDPARNLLHDHLGQGEDEDLRLEPDCADLPYFLRTYFAWKLRLPMAYRQCSRGREGTPPSCGEPLSNVEEIEPTSDALAGRGFIRRVKAGVHSGSARTVPRDDDTDLYPVPLTREALRPGTVYADPYGHLLVIARWIPQGLDDYGILVGADAQPDGTVGRRRFWRGSFLFSPETTDVGAGFKAWRPVSYVRRDGGMSTMSNAELRRTTEHVPWSDDQYTGSTDDFYDRMEALINPRPLDPAAMQGALVDALEESVARRINSVNNGLEYMVGRRWPTVDMPTGYDIFETAGPWEDFATPSRDMRLLISIDAVLAFPDSVGRAPERYGVLPQEVDATVAGLREALAADLRARTFQYTRTDGSSFTLSLQDLVSRRERMEMAYNLNDCAEIRWGAAPGSEEMRPCRNQAPAAQRARMGEYRAWFQARRRPPR